MQETGLVHPSVRIVETVTDGVGSISYHSGGRRLLLPEYNHSASVMIFATWGSGDREQKVRQPPDSQSSFWP